MGDCKSKIKERFSSQDQNVNNALFLTLSTLYFSDKGKLTTRKTFCPLNHSVTNIKRLTPTDTTVCKRCLKKYKKKQFTPFFTCTECRYEACCRCLWGSLQHQDVCAKPQIKYWKESAGPSISCQCCFCGKEVLGVLYCRSCLVFGCMKCMTGGMEKNCQHEFQFRDDRQFVCFGCQKKGKNYMKCHKCKISMCKKCCKQQIDNLQ